MRMWTSLLVAVALGACASVPTGNVFLSEGPVAATQGFDCFVNQAGGLGYASMSRTGTEVRMERVNDEPFWLNAIGINDSVDVLIANSQGTPGRLQVGAYSLVLRGQDRDAAAPSDDARREAQQIVQACA